VHILAISPIVGTASLCRQPNLKSSRLKWFSHKKPLKFLHELASNPRAIIHSLYLAVPIAGNLIYLQFVSIFTTESQLLNKHRFLLGGLLFVSVELELASSPNKKKFVSISFEFYLIRLYYLHFFSLGAFFAGGYVDVFDLFIG
jgi:hypothetical protein